MQSPESVSSYFVGQHTKAGQAVISLVVHEDDVFGPNGIYTTGEEYDNWYLNGQQGERPTANFDTHGLECLVNIEFFMDGEQLSLAQRGGLRIQGGSTRWLPIKIPPVRSLPTLTGGIFIVL